MIAGWIKSALQFGIEAAHHDLEISLDLEKMAKWLTANPTGSFEEFANERSREV